MNKPGVKLTLLLASSLTVMSGAAIAPALPLISDHFSGHPQAEYLSKLVLTIPGIGIALLSPAAGWLADRFSKLRLLSIAILLYVAAGTAGLYINDLYLLLASRFTLGMSVAFIMPIATALIGEYFAGAEQRQFLGTQAAFMSLGGTVFVAASGILADIGWRYPFVVYGFGLLVLLLVFRFLPEPESSSETSDSQATLTPPSLPVRTLTFTYLAALLGMVIFYVIPVQSPFLFREIGIEGSFWRGFGLIAVTLVSGFASSFYSRVKGRFTFGQIYLGIFGVIGIAYIAIGLLNSYIPILLAISASGFGIGMLMPNSNFCLIDLSSSRNRGRVIGGMVSAVFLGQFLSPILVNPLVAATSISTAHIWVGAFSLVFGALYPLVFFRSR